MASITSYAAYFPGSAFEPTADLFQSLGGDSSSLAALAPQANDWLYGFGLGDGLGDGSSSGGEGDGTLDGGNALAIDWSLADLNSSHETTPILGNEASPGGLEDLLPVDGATLFFNSLPVSTMPSATSIPTNQTDHYPMSPPTLNYDPTPLQQQQSPQPQQQQPSSGKRRSPPVDHVTALKRQRNNVAARKYRQKRIDRINELELELDEVKQERDDLKIRLARQEAEAKALKMMLEMKTGEAQKS
ncbi:hypothetical protein F4777DRAFT_579246 [Nemania sp. FL0916]|nr:hypothetical protein F4777DRAFT_579246 [Nemania sp. FL0916]